MTAGRILLVVFGAIAAFSGLALCAGGGVLLWAHGTQRDADGFYATSTERFTTETYALTSNVDLGQAPGEHDWTLAHPVGTVRIRATGSESEPIFVGIAPQADVDRWLAGVSHAHVSGANFGPFRSHQSALAGDHAPTVPTAQSIWAASAVGPGTQTVLWPSEGGRWAIVVMNPDAHIGVAADVSVGAKTAILLPIGIALATIGMLLLVGGTAMLFFGLRHQTAEPTLTPSENPALPTPGSYPVRLNGHLDPQLSRWQWLVKWLLIIPHVIVLTVLWIAAAMLTIVAGIAILFTGRYPRSIFDFNVGVMRWTWRVSFYGISALATDRYPPFTLRSDPDYPADFTVDYPERLSRGLVLVKWWLLALPHYLIVAIFVGGWSVGRTGGWRVAGSVGLITLLVVVAVVALAVRARYPESIFDFVMGMNRWCYRVLAYAALMRDDYPPFRLDNGGLDPGSVPSGPAPPQPDSTRPLVETSSQ
jgi:hypothetical protein